MKHEMFKFALAVAGVVGTGALFAQEMGAAPAQPAVAVTAANPVASQVAEKPVVPAKPVVPVVQEKAPNDPGPKIVADAQQWKQQSEKPVAAGTGTNQTATELAEAALQKNGLRQGFCPGSRAIIQIGVASDTVKDATTSKTFMQLREGLAREALLNARVQIVRAIRQKMSAGESIIESDSAEFDKYKEKHAEEFAELERQKQKVANLLKLMDAAEAATLEGRTLEDDWDAVVEGIIKRIDATYDPSKVAGEKKARYIEMKQAYEQAKNQLEALKKAYNSDPIGKSISDVKACFDLELYGINVIYQAESLSEDGSYEIACAAVWSPKLQERALITLNGEKPSEVSSKPGALSLEDWLADKYQTGGIAKMVGPRQYVDDKGVQHVIAFAAREVSANARAAQREQEKADLEAERLVLSSLYEQTSGSKEKHDELMMYAGEDNVAVRETDVLGSYAKKLNGKTPERPVSGLAKVFSARLEHPFTGKKIYVSVAGIDMRLAFQAEQLLDDITAAGVKDVTRVNYVKGKEDVRKRVLEHARTSPEAYNQGQKDAVQSLANKLGVNPAAPAATPATVVPVNRGDVRPRTGAVSGDAEKINADF